MRLTFLNGGRKEDCLTRLSPYLGGVREYPTIDTLSDALPPPSLKSYRLTWTVFTLLFCLLLVRLESCQAEFIGLSAIEQIESSNNPNAIGDRGNSVGRYQISKGLLSDFNSTHKTDWTHEEMRSPDQAEIVALWAFQSRFPTLLKRLNKPVSTRNLIICWNAGCGRVSNPPLSTKKYLKKYQQAGGVL